jgi:hypothetical protein
MFGNIFDVTLIFRKNAIIMPLVSFDFSPSFQRTIIPVDLHINSVVTIGSRKTEEINVLKTIFFFYGLGGS